MSAPKKESENCASGIMHWVPQDGANGAIGISKNQFLMEMVSEDQQWLLECDFNVHTRSQIIGSFDELLAHHDKI